MYLIYDTETTGLPKNYKAPVTDSDNWPRLVQLAWQLHEESGKLISNGEIIVCPDGFEIPFNAVKIHGISTEKAKKDGVDLAQCLSDFEQAVSQCSFIVGHNIEFDQNIVGAEHHRIGFESEALKKGVIDTKNVATDFCAIPGRGGRFKWPTLTELHVKLFGVAFEEAHNAAFDVDATAKCFFGLLQNGVVKTSFSVAKESIVYEAPDLSDAKIESEEAIIDEEPFPQQEPITEVIESDFVHLHNYSQYSILQGTTEINKLIAQAKEFGCPAVALTDNSNMYGTFYFVQEALKEGIKPIVGLEVNICKDSSNKSIKDNGHPVTLLAKNKKGYHNLAKICSLACTDGFYYVPRVDKTILETYKSDLIVLTGGIFSEIPSLILNEGESKAEEEFLWYKKTFGNDFYVELNRHGLEEENFVNKVLLEFSISHNVRVIAANANFYLKSTDAKTQDILTCVKDGALVQQPAKYVGKRGREYRYGLPNEEFYFKSPREMKELFADQPLSIENTIRIANQVEEYELKRDVLLPKFDIPETFQDEDEFLRHLTYEGAAKRYEEITDEIRARIDFELETIAKTGYPGYFLIVQDVTTKARELGTWVGPGRGSAAGSAVAYCIGITNVDPIKYDLLFERFLNPDRISLPDIDIDFDDEGRDKVIQYVIDKYGASQVAQIITYGTMGGKSAIRDTARVLDLPLDEAGRLAKLIPNSPPSTTLAKIIGKSEAELKKKFRSDDIPGLIELQNITKEDSPRGEVLRQAFNAEGAVRNTGVHACGVIIAPEDITNLVPVANAKDSQLRVTQFDNNVVESAGLLKMDFLGLKTLTIMKDAIQMIRERHGRDINPDEIPLDDETTFSLFQDGSTLGIFQFESPGMRKYLKELKPTRLEDLIAMNALYRPGPMEYIPDFIDRKHGRSAIQYDLDAMEEFLEETYGITVYQEQVMLLSQKLGNFTKGMADSLRKGMGKKKKEIIDELKPVFFEGCEANGHDLKIVEKIWNDWEAFASYAFNKSHSTCYAYIAYQTGYLKANYPAEFMASVLTHNMSSIEKITFFIEECRQLGIDVLSPDVNESHRGFSVNKNGQIRFGLAGIKGVGEKAIEELIICRDEHGYFEDVFDLCKKVNLRAVNKKTMENLCSAGAFDCFETSHRAQYFATPENESMTGLEKAIKYGADFKDNLNATQHSLFGEKQLSELTTPILPEAEKYDLRDKLKEEKKLIGFYLSAHPLDPYKLEVQSFTSCGVGSVGEKPGVFKVAGIISEIAIRTSKNGKEFAFFNIEDFDGVLKIGLFGEDFLKFKHFLVDGFQLFLKLEVKPRPYNANELETKVRSIELLADIRQKLTKRLSLTLPLENVDDDFIQKIQELVEENQGKYPLKVVVLDQSTKFQISLNGANCKVDINDKLIKKLETFRGVNYKLN